MNAASSSETSIVTYQTTRRHNLKCHTAAMRPHNVWKTGGFLFSITNQHYPLHAVILTSVMLAALPSSQFFCLPTMPPEGASAVQTPRPKPDALESRQGKSYAVCFKGHVSVTSFDLCYAGRFWSWRCQWWFPNSASFHRSGDCWNTYYGKQERRRVAAHALWQEMWSRAHGRASWTISVGQSVSWSFC